MGKPKKRRKEKKKKPRKGKGVQQPVVTGKK